MKSKQDLYNYDSLAFFGSVNAAISHELKNILAIISETAGLLGDLSEMAKGGTPIDPDMLSSSTDSIIEEIQRGFITIRQMNRFSHSVDTPVTAIDLMQILDLVRNLSGYLSFTGKMHIHPVEGVTTPIVLTCPLILQAVIYQVVVQMFQNADTGAELNVSVRSEDVPTWQILLDGFPIKEFESLASDRIKRMATSIGVSTHWDRVADRMKIDVPFSIEGIA